MRGGRGGMRGGAKVVVEPHRHNGVFIAKGKEDALVTKNLVPGDTVYGEKKVVVEVEPPPPFLPPSDRTRRGKTKSSTASGTPSARRSRRQSSAASTTFGSAPAARSSTSAPRPARPSATCPT